jgi:hypothetical protein
LRSARLPHALIGALAVWQYVPPEAQRMTKDVDFAVPRGYSEQAAQIAAKRGYRVQELDIGGYSVRGSGVVVDFIDRHPELGELYLDAVTAAQKNRVRLGRTVVPLVPIEHLIAMKLATGEDKDERDVQELLAGVPPRRYPSLRSSVGHYLGFLGKQRLDTVARRIGHPGPGMKKRYK